MSKESASNAGSSPVSFRRGPGAGFVAVPEKAQNQAETLKRFAGYLVSEKLHLAAMLCCVLVAAAASVAAPAFQSEAIDVIVRGEYSELYGYLLISGRLSGSGKGQTSFFCLERTGFLNYLRIEHDHIHESHGYNYYPFTVSDHVGSHSDTSVPVGCKSVLQVLCYLNVSLRCRFGLLS